jgi:hypothetical protein
MVGGGLGTPGRSESGGHAIHPRATLEDSLVSRIGTGRGPLGDAAGEVFDAIGCRATGMGADRLEAEPCRDRVPQPRGLPGIAPWIGSAAIAPRGELPLVLARKSCTVPRAIGSGIGPGDVDNGIPRMRRGRAPWPRRSPCAAPATSEILGVAAALRRRPISGCVDEGLELGIRDLPAIDCIGA